MQLGEGVADILETEADTQSSRADTQQTEADTAPSRADTQQTEADTCRYDRS